HIPSRLTFPKQTSRNLSASKPTAVTLLARPSTQPPFSGLPLPSLEVLDTLKQRLISVRKLQTYDTEVPEIGDDRGISGNPVAKRSRRSGGDSEVREMLIGVSRIASL